MRDSALVVIVRAVRRSGLGSVGLRRHATDLSRSTFSVLSLCVVLGSQPVSPVGCWTPIVEVPADQALPSCEIDSDCDDEDVCTADACESGMCIYRIPESVDDGLFCNGTERCVGGSLVHSGNPCAGTNRPACDESSRMCFWCESDGDCDDDDECTVDLCVGGACDHEFIQIDDGLFCNGRESCDSVTGRVMSSGDPCAGHAASFCIEEAQRCAVCAEDSDCDDEDVCTIDLCDADWRCAHILDCAFDDACRGREGCPACFEDAHCDDDNVCTVDTCAGGDCVHDFLDAIDDGLFCNGEDSCEGGELVHAGDPCAGTDFPACDEISDTCFACEIDAECDDGDACTRDWCADRNCLHFVPNPDDGVFCNGAEVCDPLSGEVSRSGDPCIGTDSPYCVERSRSCAECLTDADCGASDCEVSFCGASGACEVERECALHLECAVGEACTPPGCCRESSAEATIDIVPLLDGPYEPGELVDFDICVRRTSLASMPDVRLIQFDFASMESALGEPIEFTFETSSIADDLYRDFGFGTVYNITYEGLSGLPGTILHFAGGGACSKAATFSLRMPDEAGTFVIDVVNENAPNFNTGALLQHGFIETASWWYGDGDLDGGRLVVQVE